MCLRAVVVSILFAFHWEEPGNEAGYTTLQTMFSHWLVAVRGGGGGNEKGLQVTIDCELKDCVVR